MEKTRTAGWMKIQTKLPGGKSSGAKVEDGTGFNAVWRHNVVYQRARRGKASSC